MADCPEFVSRSAAGCAGFVAAPVEKTRPRETIRSEKSATVAVWQLPLHGRSRCFKGLNTMHFYVAVGWLPTILVDHGISARK